MSAIANKIMKRVRGKGRGWVFTPKDFIDFGTRGSIDMALSRLAQSETIRRVGRGIYDYPKQHTKLGTLSPNADSLAQAISRQGGNQITTSGAAAANQLGFSTQVPAKTTYSTSGPTNTKSVAGRTLTLKHARAPIIVKASDRANAALQALTHIGKDRIDADMIRQLAHRLDDHDVKALIKARPRMPGWMGDIVLKIGTLKHG